MLLNESLPKAQLICSSPPLPFSSRLSFPPLSSSLHPFSFLSYSLSPLLFSSPSNEIACRSVSAFCLPLVIPTKGERDLESKIQTFPEISRVFWPHGLQGTCLHGSDRQHTVCSHVCIQMCISLSPFISLSCHLELIGLVSAHVETRLDRAQILASGA